MLLKLKCLLIAVYKPFSKNALYTQCLLMTITPCIIYQLTQWYYNWKVDKLKLRMWNNFLSIIWNLMGKKNRDGT